MSISTTTTFMTSDRRARPIQKSVTRAGIGFEEIMKKIKSMNQFVCSNSYASDNENHFDNKIVMNSTIDFDVENFAFDLKKTLFERKKNRKKHFARTIASRFNVQTIDFGIL